MQLTSCELWHGGKTSTPKPSIFTLDCESETFTKYFDSVQEDLEALASVDPLLTGKLY